MKLHHFILLSLIVLVPVAVSAQESGKVRVVRTRAQLDALIEREGKALPTWFKETPLNYPQTLDLSWPEGPPAGGWNNQKNVGQYVWDIINPNPGRWREGVRLMHHLLTLNKDDPEKRERIMLTMCHMYHDLLEDYARAAFWYRAVGVEKDPEEFAQSAVILAECYWRLGCRDEALKLLAKVPPSVSQAKLLGDMGETDKAIRMALSDEDAQGYDFLAAGDACRQAGRYQDALGYYQKVLSIEVPAKNPPGRLLKNRNRAEANVSAIKAFELFDPKRVPDGKYVAASQGYEGAVEVTVTMKSNRIADVAVTKHREKQFYSAISDTTAKFIAKQSVKGVDTTSNATITSEAIINATAKALVNRK